MDGGDDSGWISNTPDLQTYIHLLLHTTILSWLKEKKKMSCVYFFFFFSVQYVFLFYNMDILTIYIMTSIYESYEVTNNILSSNTATQPCVSMR